MKLTTILILLFLISILGGCAGRNKISPPDWDLVAIPDTQVTDPVSLPLLCEIVAIEDAEGTRYGAWSPACWKVLSEYEIIAEGNTDIAEANANALRNTEAGYNALLNAGKLQQELGNFYLELYEDEKSGRFIDSVLYRSLIGLGFIVVML